MYIQTYIQTHKCIYRHTYRHSLHCAFSTCIHVYVNIHSRGKGKIPFNHVCATRKTQFSNGSQRGSRSSSANSNAISLTYPALPVLYKTTYADQSFFWIHTHRCKHTFIHAYIHTYIHTPHCPFSTRPHMPIKASCEYLVSSCDSRCIYVCMYVCMYVYMYTCMNCVSKQYVCVYGHVNRRYNTAYADQSFLRRPSLLLW